MGCDCCSQELLPVARGDVVSVQGGYGRIRYDWSVRGFIRAHAEIFHDRLALAHNQLSTFPASLSQCHRLRYLNVRYNALRELPEPVRMRMKIQLQASRIWYAETETDTQVIVS